jgi:hypothetical protein
VGQPFTMASESSSKQPRQEPSEQARPTDLPALARDALELADDLERAWSSALDPDALETAHEGLRARWSTFAEALRRVLADTDAELEAAGVDVTLKEWPPSRGLLADLDLSPSDPQDVFKQLQTALLLALRILLVRSARLPSRQSARWRAFRGENSRDGGSQGHSR